MSPSAKLIARKPMKSGAVRKPASARVPQSKEQKPHITEIRADARAIPLPDGCIDLVVTSPPYWQKRDYGFSEQIGLEETPDEFVGHLIDALREWRRLLAPHGSVFLNIGDSYSGRSLASVPGRLEIAACADGWKLRNRIIWAKEGGMPDPAKNRLANRHEYILHFTKNGDYYYDSFGYSNRFGNGSTPSDVWTIPLRRDMSGHLAPFPEELVERAITLACPEEVCLTCGKARRRIVERTAELDSSRPQAKRAMELAKEYGLTPAHIAAIQATGISDAGKALRVQTGTGKNTAAVKRLADEAKKVLGGYFREFTFARKRSVGWTSCDCNGPYRRGTILDPFKGSGTTLRVASSMARSAVGVDFAPSHDTDVWGAKASHGKGKQHR
jgi:DNA modification methylase